MTNMFQKISQISVVILLSCISSLALHAQSTIIIKGQVSDKKTGKPIGTELKIEGAKNGRKYTVTVNSKSGEYTQPVQSGDTYTLTFASMNIFRHSETLVIEATDKYREEVHNYSLSSIVQGDIVKQGVYFDAGSAELTSLGKQHLDEIKLLAKNNRDLRLEFLVSDDPPKPKVIAPPVKKAKPAKKGKNAPTPVEVIPAPSIDIPNFASMRIETLKKYCEDVRNVEIRFSYTQSPDIARTGEPNVRVTIGVVKSLTDD